jgi:hypothetical protein
LFAFFFVFLHFHAKYMNWLFKLTVHALTGMERPGWATAWVQFASDSNSFPLHIDLFSPYLNHGMTSLPPYFSHCSLGRLEGSLEEKEHLSCSEMRLSWPTGDAYQPPLSWELEGLCLIPSLPSGQDTSRPTVSYNSPPGKLKSWILHLPEDYWCVCT